MFEINCVLWTPMDTCMDLEYSINIEWWQLHDDLCTRDCWVLMSINF